MYTRTILLIAFFVTVANVHAGLLRNPEKPLDKLSDEDLGIKNGDLTPKKLTKYKKRVTELKASLDTLMARQTVLNVEYNTLVRQENRDNDLKRKVKGMVARSVLKGMASMTDDRKSHVSGIVDQAVKRIKDEYSLKLPHPDHPEIDASGTSGNYTNTNSTETTDKNGTVALDKDAGPSGNDESGPSGASGASSSGPESLSDSSN
jgi:hypothetical protein